ncbi:hypothetical protein IW261DRAFT_1426443 [Armillaria novae-zelandiae]|uniref:Uncharacterized protein n=1 Tax=Armillaria novae-zelandiae TaxID=153914 RepID=A0AA39NL50_9AGAR|nr:hypothetical protein IW261DRAFT_1426443 [Armillaria novae-zelandiae]
MWSTQVPICLLWGSNPNWCIPPINGPVTIAKSYFQFKCAPDPFFPPTHGFTGISDLAGFPYDTRINRFRERSSSGLERTKITTGHNLKLGYFVTNAQRRDGCPPHLHSPPKAYAIWDYVSTLQARMPLLSSRVLSCIVRLPHREKVLGDELSILRPPGSISVSASSKSSSSKVGVLTISDLARFRSYEN